MPLPSLTPDPLPESRRVQVLKSYGRLPLAFVPNVGQTHPSVWYVARRAGYALFLTAEEAVFVFRSGPEGDGTVRARPDPSVSETGRHARAAVVRLRFARANPGVQIEGEREAEGRANFFRGNDPSRWRTNVPTYRAVRYRGLWPGVDLVFGGEQGQLKSEFHVQPGARVDAIQLVYSGAEDVSLDDEGSLRVTTALGILSERRPESYQVVAGQRMDVDSRFALRRGQTGETVLGFEVGSGYDPGATLVIDPALLYSTYLGGSASDVGGSIAVDRAGNAYLTGFTISTNFPTANALQPDNAGGADAFVAKLDPTGSALLYSTYLGGSSDDVAYGIALDGAGHAFVTGYTSSANFPTANALQPLYGGDDDAFVVKLDPSGSAVVYSTYLGGSSTEYGYGIAVDRAGNACVTGQTFSTDFPTANALQPNNAGGPDAFVTKIDPTGSALVYSTYLGGFRSDSGNAIAVDGAGNVHVTGFTNSIHFPTAHALQPSKAGGTDAFVAKLDPAGSALLYSTYLGGSSGDYGYGVTVDGAGNAYVTGYTTSTDFPTVNALQPNNAGLADTFVSKLNPTGSALLYSTYLGGSGDDYARSIAVDGAANVYVTGQTSSSDFPTADAPQPQYGGGAADAFLTELNPMGSALVYSTYLGGSSPDSGYGIAVEAASNAYVTGQTLSADFPTVNALQPRYAGGSDAFVTKIGEVPTCNVVGYQQVCVDADIAISVTATTGEVTVACLTPPTIHPLGKTICAPTGIPCGFTAQVTLCVAVPVSFGTTATTAAVRQQCNAPTATSCLQTT